MKRTATSPGLFVTAMLITALIVGLHQLGNIEGLRFDWSDPVGWLGSATAEEAIGALLRSMGLVAGYWITASTALYTATTIRGRDKSGRFLRLVTLPGIRRVVDRAFATALAASIVATPLSPAVADEQPPPAVVFDINTDGIPIPHVRPNFGTSSRAEPMPALPDPITARPTPSITTQSRVAPSPPPAITHTVATGENLWRIADGRLQAEFGTRPTTAVVAEYWRRLIDANRMTLRSGDPNLIYPGEIIAIPPLEAGA